MSKRTLVSYNATWRHDGSTAVTAVPSVSILITTLYRKHDTQCSTPPIVAVKLVQFHSVMLRRERLSQGETSGWSSTKQKISERPGPAGTREVTWWQWERADYRRGVVSTPREQGLTATDSGERSAGRWDRWMEMEAGCGLQHVLPGNKQRQ